MRLYNIESQIRTVESDASVTAWVVSKRRLFTERRFHDFLFLFCKKSVLDISKDSTLNTTLYAYYPTLNNDCLFIPLLMHHFHRRG